LGKPAIFFQENTGPFAVICIVPLPHSPTHTPAQPFWGLGPFLCPVAAGTNDK
jgi:hypothetical protein